MAYWGTVARRAWFETAKTVKLDSRKLLMVLVLGQVVIGTILYLALGSENLPANVFARAATIAAPFLLFVPVLCGNSSHRRRKCTQSKLLCYSA
jgi:hypothetical protein